MKPFRVLYFVSELSPVSGGSPLALAAAALCRELGARALDLTVVVPRAGDRDPEQFGYARRLEPLLAAVGGSTVEAMLFEGKLPSGGGRVFVIDTAQRAHVVAAGLELVRQRGLWPDVIHAGHGTNGVAETLAAFDFGELPEPATVSSDDIDIPPGIDETRWQTAADPIERKPEAKLDLQRAWGLPPRAKTPLIAVLGPIDPSVLGDAAAAEIAGLDAQVALLAEKEADREAVQHMRDLGSRNPTRVAARVAEDDSSVRAVLEAADLALLPRLPTKHASSDLFCARYGAVPIAPAAADFARLLVDFDPQTATGNGFLFALGAASAAAVAARRAVRAFHQHPREFEILARRVAAVDVSWGTAALRHVELYRRSSAPR